MSGVYVHIPFCVQKCAYCDFVSYQVPDIESAAPAYLGAVLGELRLRQDELCSMAPVDTVYVGGGTPTCVPPQLLGARGSTRHEADGHRGDRLLRGA